MNDPKPGTPAEADGHASDDLLIDFAFGLLPEERRGRVAAHIAACARCDDALREIVADRERRRSWWRSEGAARTRPSASPRRGWSVPSRRSLMVPVGLAAAALLALLVMPPSRAVLEPTWLPGPGPELESRGPNAGGRDEFVWRGLAAYGRHDLAQAMRVLGSARAEEAGTERLRRTYLASALLLAEQPRQALDALEGVELETLPDPWRNETRWLRACALARLGRAEESRAELEHLAREQGAPAERARRALALPRR